MIFFLVLDGDDFVWSVKLVEQEKFLEVFKCSQAKMTLCSSWQPWGPAVLVPAIPRPVTIFVLATHRIQKRHIRPCRRLFQH